MRTKKRIGIIGCIADGHAMYDGQTISTRLWRDELINRCNGKIVEVDTYNYKRRIVSTLYNLFKCIFSCSHIVIMLSGDGLKAILPIVYYSSKLFNIKVYHRVIGGELDTFVSRNPECKKYLNGLEINWVQSPKLVQKLNGQGIKNAAFLENFRRIEPIQISNRHYYNETPFRFCTFCRVSEAKGIGEAICSIHKINKKYGDNTVSLDIYGPIEDNYKEEFNRLVQGCKDVHYMGSVESTKAVSVLENYYMHLFPTTWSGEGFPGALIDCYNAGLPTIATNWAYNGEYIKNDITGYLYDWREKTLLTDRIDYAINHCEEVYVMRNNCIKEAELYTADTIMNKIYDFMKI